MWGGHGRLCWAGGENEFSCTGFVSSPGYVTQWALPEPNAPPTQSVEIPPVSKMHVFKTSESIKGYNENMQILHSGKYSKWPDLWGKVL